MGYITKFHKSDLALNYHLLRYKIQFLSQCQLSPLSVSNL